MLGIKTFTNHKIIPYIEGTRVRMLRKNIVLAMTLLVRDEVDIIETNIKYHLSQGVDIIVVMDNGSTDGTVDVLEKYKKLGKVDYIINKESGFLQDKWVSNLIAIAIDKYKADFVINSDADEFWVPKYFNLKTMVLVESDNDVIAVPVRNYLPPQDMRKKNFNLLNFEYFINKTVGVPADYRNREINDLWLYRYSDKLITSKKIRKIGFGNDTIKYRGKIVSTLTSAIDIYHFPIRSWKHFETKVKNGGRSIMQNPSKDMGMGWQWRSWYKIYRQGKLKEQYKVQTLKNRWGELMSRGVIRKSNLGFLNVA